MKKVLFCFVLAAASAGAALAAAPKGHHQNKTWSVKADYIEACSCSMFCSCYFNDKPEGGEMCEFDNALKITQGHVGDVDVSGRKVWLSGDLGGDFAHAKAAVITFEPGTPQAQKDAITFLITKIYPSQWQSVKFDEAPITWERNGMDGHAMLGDGEKGDIVLKGIRGANGKQAVINNVKYWGADRNNGFELAYGTHHYKGNGFNYTHENRNGFFIHIESSGTE